MTYCPQRWLLQCNAVPFCARWFQRERRRLASFVVYPVAIFWWRCTTKGSSMGDGGISQAHCQSLYSSRFFTKFNAFVAAPFLVTPNKTTVESEVHQKHIVLGTTVFISIRSSWLIDNLMNNHRNNMKYYLYRSSLQCSKKITHAKSSYQWSSQQ